LILAPKFAYVAKPQLLWPPVLGQQDVTWASVFQLIKQPEVLWDQWKPSQTLDMYGTVQAIWDLFHEGESVYSNGIKTGKKPPLSLVEDYFGSRWRPHSQVNLYRFSYSKH